MLKQRLQSLIEARGRAVEEMRAHLEGLPAEPSAEERSKTENFDTAVLGLDEEIGRVRQMIANDAAVEEARSEHFNAGPASGSGTEARRTDDDILREIALGETRSHTFTSEVATAEGVEEQRDTILRAAHPDWQPQTFVNQLLTYLTEYSSIMRLGPTVLTTSDGREIKFPRLTLGGPIQRVEEGHTRRTNRQRATSGNFFIRAYQWGDIFVASRELFRDSVVNISQVIAQDQAWAIAQGMGEEFYNGEGGELAPEGVLKHFPTVDAPSEHVDFDTLIDLFHSVAVPYRTNAKWLIGDGTVQALRKIREHNDGPYLWRDALTSEQPFPTFMGKPVVVEPIVPAPGFSADAENPRVSVAFGDFNRGLLLRNVGGVEVSRSTEAYFETSEVGIKVELSADLRVRDPNAARLLVHPTAP